MNEFEELYNSYSPVGEREGHWQEKMTWELETFDKTIDEYVSEIHQMAADFSRNIPEASKFALDLVSKIDLNNLSEEDCKVLWTAYGLFYREKHPEFWWL